MNTESYFPPEIYHFVSTAAKALGCDESYISVPLLPVLAGAVGNTRRIRLKQSWSEPAVIWAAIAADSGTVKSPAQELATKPAWRWQRKILKQYATERAEYASALRAWKATPKKSRSDDDEPTPPEPCKHPVCSDITVEALADRLQSTPRGTLVCLDELSAWFGSFNQYKSGGADVAHWLTMHGARALKVDRKTGDKTTIYVPNAAVSICGTIQPETLRRALTTEFFDNGLAARLLVSMPPTTAKRWTENEIDRQTADAVDSIFEHLYDLKQAPGVDGDDEPVMVDLTPDARSAFAQFVNEHGQQTMNMEGAARASWSKLEAYAARFALIRHCCRQASSEKELDYIDASDIQEGVKLARSFGEETLRVYRLMHESDEDRGRRELLQWIADHGGRVTVRDLQRNLRKYENSNTQAEIDLQALVDGAFGSWEFVAPGNKGGQPTRYFVMAESPDFTFSSRADADTTHKNPTKPGVVSAEPVENSFDDRWNDPDFLSGMMNSAELSEQESRAVR